MKWWSEFWKLRKQNDRVKIQLIVGCIGIVCIGIAVYQGSSFYRLLHTPIEYICTCVDSNGGLETKLSQVQELDYIDAVSRQKVTSVEITTQWGTLTIPCLMVSEDYLRDAYGVNKDSGMQTFYLNQTAYENILRTIPSSETDMENMHVGYIMGEEKGIAKLLSGSERMPNDSPYAFCTGDPIRLQKEGEQLRIRVRQQDLSGVQGMELKQLGIQIENEEKLEEGRLLQEQKFLEIKYNLCIAVLCMCFVWCLKKYGK